MFLRVVALFIVKVADTQKFGEQPDSIKRLFARQPEHFATPICEPACFLIT